MLEISIPTFNRASKLAATLEVLLPQLRDGVILRICDNASTDHTRSVASEFESRAQGRISYIRNTANVGGDANIIRCLERAEAEWIWILGDDDLPAVNAIDLILSEIAANSDLQFINFATTILDIFSLKRVERVFCASQKQLCESLDHFGNLLFISANVLRPSFFQTELPVGYAHIASHSVLVAMLLSGAKRIGFKCAFVTPKICTWQASDRSAYTDSNLVVGSFGALVDLIVLAEDRRKFNAKIWSVCSFYDAYSLRLAAAMPAEEKLRFVQRFLPTIVRREIADQRLPTLTSEMLRFLAPNWIRRAVSPFSRCLRLVNKWIPTQR